MDVFEFVTVTVARIMDVDKDDLCLQTDFIMELGMDQQELFDIVLECEEQYSIDIADAEIETIKTLADLVNMVEQKKS